MYSRLRGLVRSTLVRNAPLVARMLRRRGGRAAEDVLILGSKAHGREIVRRLRALGFRTVLVDSEADTLNWLYADEVVFLDPYASENVDTITELANQRGVAAVLMQSDDELLPTYYAVNNRLSPKPKFGARALRTSLSKAEMRKALLEAQLPTVPYWPIDSLEQLKRLESSIQFPVVLKPVVGQGARGSRFCYGSADLRAGFLALSASGGPSEAIVESYLHGRQFNVDGLMYDGEPFVYLITEEGYDRYKPRIMPCWYLFNPLLSADEERAVVSAASAAVQACGLNWGAFHVEVKFDGQRYVAIDLSNRMGADFPVYARLTTGRDQIGDYSKAMLKDVKPNPKTAFRSFRARIYNYNFDPGFQKIRAECESHPGIVETSSGATGDIYEFTAGEEALLRGLVERVEALGALAENASIQES